LSRSGNPCRHLFMGFRAAKKTHSRFVSI
jgi:hypothetical protein